MAHPASPRSTGQGRSRLFDSVNVLPDWDGRGLSVPGLHTSKSHEVTTQARSSDLLGVLGPLVIVSSVKTVHAIQLTTSVATGLCKRTF
ncbi:hypothetical protein J6590_005186 [Homalodisca vitripennis]|nr:hypothetical protein J6590_005186 [Homalodisca vitripennis]